MAKTPAMEPSSDLWSKIEREISPRTAPATRKSWVSAQGLRLAGAAAVAAAILLVVMNESVVFKPPEKAPTRISKAVPAPKGIPLPDEKPVARENTITGEPVRTAAVPVHSYRRPYRRHRARTVMLAMVPAPAVVERTIPVYSETANDSTKMASTAGDWGPRRGALRSPASMADRTWDKDSSHGVYGFTKPGAETAVAAPTAATTRAEVRGRADRPKHTSVDLMNSADRDAKVSALFSYP